MANEIQIYKNNSKTVACTVTGTSSLTGYTATMTCKKSVYDAAADELFSVTGTINSLVISFDLTPTETNIAAGDYVYDITVSDGTNVYTVVQSKLTILESVKY